MNSDSSQFSANILATPSADFPAGGDNVKVEPTILAQTADWIIVDKPAGWLTRPPSPGKIESLASHVVVPPILSDWLKKEFHPQVRTVHRLDRETSGLVMFAQNEEAHRKANLWFEKRLVRKSYYALSLGIAMLPSFQSRESIGDQPAQTLFEVLETFSYPEPLSWIRARPMTGRRHQIRVHLSQRQLPLVGDSKYGGRLSAGLSGILDRIALHAHRLELPSGESFEAPLSVDLKAALEALRSVRR